MEAAAAPATAESFMRYGVYRQLTSEAGLQGDGWEVWMTEEVCLEGPARFGICFTSGAPYQVEQLTRYENSKTLIMCGDRSLVLTVADSQAQEPRSDDIRSFLINPGDIVLLNEGIWHDFGHGADGSAYCYFLAMDGARSLHSSPLHAG